MMIQPVPNTGYCACVLAGPGLRRAASRFIIFPIIESPAVTKKQDTRVKRRPLRWPDGLDYVTSRTAKDVFAETRPNESDDDGVSQKKTRYARAGALAAVIQAHCAVESFVLLIDPRGVPQAVHEVGMARGDHMGSLHVLEKARALYFDLPPFEHHFIWGEVRSGGLLTEREREGIREGACYTSMIDPDSHFVQTGEVEIRPRLPQPPPSQPMQKAGVDDPGLDAALERLRRAIGA